MIAPMKCEELRDELLASSHKIGFYIRICTFGNICQKIILYPWVYCNLRICYRGQRLHMDLICAYTVRLETYKIAKYIDLC